MKYRVILVLSILFTIILCSCGSSADCERKNTGTLIIKNTNNFPAEVRLDGELLFVLTAQETMQKDDVSSGKHQIRSVSEDLRQLDAEIIIEKCEETNFEIVY